MHKQFLQMALAGVLSFGLGTVVKADDYTIDAVHSGVSFQILHAGVSYIQGRFDDFSGSFTIDTGDPALLEARLKALAEPGNVWRPLAQEQLALLDLRQGKTQAAKAALTKLAQDVTAPNGVRERAAALLGRLG